MNKKVNSQTSNTKTQRMVWIGIAIVIILIICGSGTVFLFWKFVLPNISGFENNGNMTENSEILPSHYGVFIRQENVLVELPEKEIAHIPIERDIDTSPVLADLQPIIVIWQQDTVLDNLRFYKLGIYTGQQERVEYYASPKENGVIEITPKASLESGGYCLIQSDPLASFVSAWCFRIGASGIGVIDLNNPTPTVVWLQIPTTKPQPTLAHSRTPNPSPDESVAVETDPIEMEMVFVFAGEFTMGLTAEQVDEKLEECLQYYSKCPRDWFSSAEPIHTVYLEDYWIDKFEVTNGMYRQCVQAGVCDPPHNQSSFSRESYYGESEFNNYPVIWVDWYQAKTYCEWTGKRLPTEAEWEKAARGTDGRLYPWGNEPPNHKLLNFLLFYGDTSAVGSYPNDVSPYGALDMAGNVLEWVADWYGYYGNSSTSNPAGPNSGSDKVIRGASFYHYPHLVGSGHRKARNPGGMDENLGFRCAQSP